MLVAAHLRHGLGLLVPLAVACTIYLYLYPVFGGCAFPVESRDSRHAFEQTKRLHWPFSGGAGDGAADDMAPFRLLALGDPQLEGDTSIPIAYLGVMPHLKSLALRLAFRLDHPHLRDRVRMVLHDVIDIFFEDVPNLVESVRKRIDLFGNDLYLAHIYRTLRWWSRPTHVSVLGDLVGSQWIEDGEFEQRGRRFWGKVFRGGERVPDEVAAYPMQNYSVTGLLDGSAQEDVWTRRIMNVAGNHDIGYAGDLTPERMERFERVFGKANYELRFALPMGDGDNATKRDMAASRRLPPQIRILVLNDMNLDTPAKDQGLQDLTYQFINDAISSGPAVEDRGQFTLVLTHIPLFKPNGVCVDGPFFDFYAPDEGGGVREQYLLSPDASKGLLEGVFGLSGNTGAPARGRGRSGLILNGHDHEGCDTFHFINQTNGTSASDRSWEASRWTEARTRGLPSTHMMPGRREITVRSMMGDFGGNAGLLSMWFNQSSWEWEYEYRDCPLGRQHLWWFTHLLDLSVVMCAALWPVLVMLERYGVDVDGYFLRGVGWSRRWVDAMGREGVKRLSCYWT
ncbi:Metallophosphoesterase domain protein [Ophiocordyceps camponoti-floridani]|uniref:Metallophosphoesterase domain protein n=1 Tax=Ophiocordyceps camponoti-floridani TaxID=2030778 RepID=A0A8H4Q2F8_9HYPO|nr:Metallophosphoesterase domain protein [Ophiocordyceps camponoti-floridani]